MPPHPHNLLEIPEAPNFMGSVGQAWECPDLPPEVGPHANIGRWRVRQPYAHICWYDYELSLCALRPIPGTCVPRLYLPDATHEIVLFALDPRERVRLEFPCAQLQPANFAAQFIADSDEAARQRVAAVVQEICDGHLNPDTDARAQWIRRFGDNMIHPDCK